MSKVKTSNVSRETIYGWFPIDEDKPKRSPTDIYMNLGFRHPKEDSFVGKIFYPFKMFRLKFNCIIKKTKY